MVSYSIYPCPESSTDIINFMYENEERNENTSFLDTLKAMHIANINRLKIGLVNRNSIWNKFECHQIALKATWLH